ncbi:MAG TPA: hypothetical protein VMI54_10335 [Polyangiaceae bacterium]|nr:hypothetical protein [Polyangiaceae bacterium]
MGVAAFSSAVTYGFVYDDRWTIIENAWLAHPLGELARLLATGGAVAKKVPDATRPLMVLGHALERRVFGLAAWGYHLDSVLLYGVACAVSAYLALVLTRQRPVALVAGCFFALAPAHAEAAAVVNYREDLYSAVGTAGALALLFGPIQPPRPAHRVWRAVGAAALLGAGLLGKESALAFVPLAALIAFLVPRARARARGNVWTLRALGAVVALWLCYRVPLALRGDDVPLAPHRSLAQTLLRTARFELLAVAHAIWPFTYAPDYWRQPDASGGWAIPALSVVAGVLLLGQSPRLRVPALGVGIALAAPLASCPLVRPINELADRYFFLGVLGGGLCWGWALGRVAERLALGRHRAWLWLACLPMLPFTEQASALWRSDRSLWSAAVERTPDSPRAWSALSDVYRAAGERVNADTAVERALNLNPNYPPALVSEIYGDLAFGRLELAREHLQAIDARHWGDGGGVAKARRCAALDVAAAARCIHE